MTSVQSGVKEAVERPDWPVTEHGVATFSEVERAIVTLAADDAVLAYRLQGFVAQSLAALSSQAEVMAAMAKGLEPFAALANKFTGPMVEVSNPHPDNPSRNIQPVATRYLEDAFQGLAQYRSLNGDA